MSIVCRFAPSPNGNLHLGHAHSALVNHAAAAEGAGTFLLRIEDIDATRSRPEFIRAIAEDLDWLGILPAAPPRRQSAHFPAYAAALAHLEREGLLYPAFETRGEIARAVLAKEAQGIAWPRDPDGAPLYPFPREGMPDGARRRRREAGEPYALRLDMVRACALIGATPTEKTLTGKTLMEKTLTWREAVAGPLQPPQVMTAEPARWGDVVLARKEVPASYHVAVVVDDAVQGISHVIRGQDLYAATAVHRLLQTLLGLPEPIYHHHRLVRDADGRKLSKSTGAASLAALRAAGASRAQVLDLIARNLA